MRKIIHKLRQQPEEARRHLLHILTFTGAIILIIFWFYSLGRNLTNSETKVKAKQDLAPFSVLKDSLIGGSISEPSADVIR